MGFVGFLNFGLKCIQLLAWPSLALGYPLCASIRAVETNSKYHMRKLVTYWILFSLISLFELAFVKLIKWIPFWPFLKIIAISCLVLHRFTGAYYAYKWLVHLFLSVNLWQRVQDINWLNKKKELFLMRETFLAAAERYLDENGTEALEKLIASKSNSKAPNVAQNDINAVEHEKNVAATDKIQSNNKAPNVAQNDINVVEHEENVAATDKISNNKAPNVAQNDIHAVEHEENVAATDKISNNKVPNVAQNGINTVELEENVAATDKIQTNNKVPNVAQNDINAVEHEKNVATTDKIQSNNKVPNVAQNDINAVELEENVVATDKIQTNNKVPNVAQNDINVVEHKKNVTTTDKIVKHVDTNLSRTQQKLGISTEVKELTSEATVRDYVLPVPPTLRIQKEWTCAVCQVKTTCEVTFNSHLQGRKHKSKCEQLKSSMQAMKVQGSSSTASNQEPKKAVSGNRLGQKKTQKAEETAVKLEANVAAAAKIFNNNVPNVAQNDISVMEHEENEAATDKISNNKAPNVAQNDINVVEPEENVAATYKIFNIKASNVAHNDINAVEHEENVAATNKISKSNMPNIAQNDINAVEREENVAASDKIVKHVDINLSRTQQKLGTSTKEVTSATTVRDFVLPVPPTLRIRKDWTCAVCQVKTTCEVSLNSHLQGRKHKSKCEKLKSSIQAMKVEGSSSTASNQEPKKAVSGNRLCQNKTQKAEEKLKFDVNTEQWKPRKPANAAAAAGIRESKYLFDMHNVSCSGEIDMAAHLNGRRHLSLLNEFDDILRVPNYGAMVPQGFNGLPNYGAVVPQGFNGVLNYGAMVRQAFNEVPNYGAMIPQAFNGVPNSGAMVPHDLNGVPNYGVMVPPAWD